MLRLNFRVIVVLFLLGLLIPLAAIEADRDFSGKWILDVRGSNSRALPFAPDATFTITQQDIAIRCTAPGENGSTVQWTFLLDGTETRSRIAGDSWSSKVKWEGDALLTNTIVSGVHEYTIMDHWKLSRDHSKLIISREIVQRSGVSEGELIYTHDGRIAPPAVETAPAVSRQAVDTNPPDPSLVPAPIQRRPEPAPAKDFLVPAGSRVALVLKNNLDTKHAHEGDHVYLEVSVPVYANQRQVIPRGSFVNGVITVSKAAKGATGKGQMFIRFETLTLPNGVTRDFRSRVGSADSGHGTVDPKEGTVTGERDSSGDARSVAIGAGTGATVGAIAGSAAGHPLGGVGIGAGIGAAAGLATVLHDKKADVTLPRGTMIEMVLDRDLTFSPEDLRQ
jgi:type IV secretion system protein VirB10